MSQPNFLSLIKIAPYTAKTTATNLPVQQGNLGIPYDRIVAL